MNQETKGLIFYFCGTINDSYQAFCSSYRLYLHSMNILPCSFSSFQAAIISMIVIFLILSRDLSECNPLPNAAVEEDADHVAKNTMG